MEKHAPIRNDLFLRILRGEQVDRPAVWMMRQAGRYLPEYQQVRAKYDFFTCCKRPELVATITTQPVDALGVDAAILFSDILVVPEAMGLTVQMKEGVGPVLPQTIREERDFALLRQPDITHSLGYVLDGIRATKQKLNHRVPLIGFAGAPWTIFCYMTEGIGSKGFERAKALCMSTPHVAERLLDLITDTTIAYLQAQARAGVDAIQIFDSWAGVWGAEDFRTFSLPYLQRIVQSLGGQVPCIVFARGVPHCLGALAQIGATALGIDWQTDPAFARKHTRGKILQGNLDPSALLLTDELLVKRVKHMLRAFGRGNYIANLGHGILPHTPVRKAKLFVDTVQSSV